MSLRAVVAASSIAFSTFTAVAQLHASAPPNAAGDAADAGADVDANAALDDFDVGEVEAFALTPAQPPPGAAAPRTRYLASAYGAYQFDTDLDTAGDFSVARGRAAVGAKVPLGGRLGMSAMAGYELSSYDFNDAAGLGGGEPWDDIHFGQLVVTFDYAVDERWSVFGGPIVSFAAQSGAGVSDSITAGGIIGVGYRAANNLVLRLGVAASSELEDDASVLPSFVVEWAIDEHWQLRSGALDLGASNAVGLGIGYRFDHHWSVGGHVGFVSQRFRLDDSGVAPDGVGQDERSAAAVQVTWTPQPHLQVSVQAGAHFAGELQVEDEDGNTLSRDDYDPGAFAGASLRLRF